MGMTGVQVALPGLHPAYVAAAAALNVDAAFHPSWSPWDAGSVPSWAAGLDGCDLTVASWLWFQITTLYVSGTVDMFDVHEPPDRSRCRVRAKLLNRMGSSPRSVFTAADLRPGGGRAVLAALVDAGLVHLTCHSGVDRWDSWPARVAGWENR